VGEAQPADGNLRILYRDTHLQAGGVGGVRYICADDRLGIAETVSQSRACHKVSAGAAVSIGSDDRKSVVEGEGGIPGYVDGGGPVGCRHGDGRAVLVGEAQPADDNRRILYRDTHLQAGSVRRTGYIGADDRLRIAETVGQARACHKVSAGAAVSIGS